METKRITCNTAIEAEGLKALLMEQGIVCMSIDETNSKVARGVLDNTTEVMVKEEDYERAMNIYEQQRAEQQLFRPWCPRCGSEDVELIKEGGINKRKLPMFLATALTMLPMGNMGDAEEYKCHACGKRFRRD